MRMRTLHLALYGLLALLWTVLGVGGLAGLLPGNPTAEEVHLARELGAAAVFVGWMHAWCMRNYERRLPVHLGLTLFAALFAAIHWHDWIGEQRSLASPLVSSLPFLVLASMLVPSATARALRGAGTAIVLLAVGAACGDAPDDTPLGREFAAALARPEQPVAKVKVQHVLVAFVGAKRGSESGRTLAEARTKAEQLLQRARAGEDFARLAREHSDDDGPGTYTLTQRDRGDYAEHFAELAFRLQVGEVGVAPFHRSKSPFGFHVVKRLE
jgi:hypothetical protein